MAAPRKTASAKAAETEETPEFNQVVSRTDAGRSFVTSDRFSVANVENRGRELLAIAPTNHVGPVPILVPMSELPELISDLQQLAAQPGPYDEQGE